MRLEGSFFIDVETNKEAFDKGKCDYLRGLTMYDNPYERLSVDRLDWLAGYQYIKEKAAYRDEIDRKRNEINYRDQRKITNSIYNFLSQIKKGEADYSYYVEPAIQCRLERSGFYFLSLEGVVYKTRKKELVWRVLRNYMYERLCYDS